MNWLRRLRRHSRGGKVSPAPRHGPVYALSSAEVVIEAERVEPMRRAGLLPDDAVVTPLDEQGWPGLVHIRLGDERRDTR